MRNLAYHTAEVHVIRTASSPEDLEYNRVGVECTPSALVVRGERGGGGGGFWHWLSGGGRPGQSA